MTETDHQLLEAAAKAAGLDFGVIHQRPHRRCPEGWTPWNPLADDGDALRLAVTLNMQVDVERELGGVWAACSTDAGAVEKCAEESDYPAATRRAIVRAAALLAAVAAA